MLSSLKTYEVLTMDYYQLIQTAADPIVCLNPAREILLFNESAEYLFGYKAAEVVGQLFDILIPDDFLENQRRQAAAIHQTADKHPALWSGKYAWGKHKNNSTFPLEINLSKTVLTDGSVVFTLLIKDATQQLETENIFKQSYQELMLLNRAAHELTSSLDQEIVLKKLLDKVRYLLNVEACSIWLVDLDTDELVCEQMSSPHDQEIVGWRLAPGVGNAGWVVAHGQSLIVPDAWLDEQHYQGIEEKTRYYMRSILTVPLGNLPDIIGVIQVVDVAPERFTESDVSLMESLAALATIAIENARLYSALHEAQEQLVAQERFAALGQMAATVAHELRNPLTAIRMGVDYFLQDMGEQDPRWRGAALMKSNMARIDRLVEDILFVGRAQRPKLAAGWLRPLIVSEIERWQLTISNRSLVLQTNLAEDDGLLPILLDKEQIARALSNLIANSVDILPPSGKISILFYQDGAEQIIHFTDNGPGIDAAILHQVFEPFFTTKARGTGLGLSIVKQIITQHNGGVTVISDPAQGTTFTIRLPVHPYDAD